MLNAWRSPCRQRHPPAVGPCPTLSRGDSGDPPHRATRGGSASASHAQQAWAPALESLSQTPRQSLDCQSGATTHATFHRRAFRVLASSTTNRASVSRAPSNNREHFIADIGKCVADALRQDGARDGRSSRHGRARRLPWRRTSPRCWCPLPGAQSPKPAPSSTRFRRGGGRRASGYEAVFRDPEGVHALAAR